MSVVVTLPHDRDWTVDDLAWMPDDGFRYELVDGVLLVSPAPVPAHQLVLGDLYTALRAAAPEGLLVFFAPVDFQPTNRRSFQPDLIVVRREDVGPKNVTQPPLLAVEVLSPGTRAVDLTLKRRVYEESGVASYWVLDPDAGTLVAWELRDGAYLEVANISGTEVWTAERPFPVDVPARFRSA